MIALEELHVECHSTERDPLQQKPSAGIEKYMTTKHEGQIDQQIEVGERS